jgi:CubicO group peptidase (beta-lactamase class C family)
MNKLRFLMKIWMILLSLLFCSWMTGLWFLGQSILQPVQVSNKTAELDSVLTVLHEQEFFSGVVLIAEKNEIVYSSSHGNAPDGTPVTLKTPLGIASVTKPFTAVAVMMLAAEGGVDYDTSITEYIPELPYENVTVRGLLNHTSGIHFLTLVNAVWDTTQVLDNKKLIALAAEQQPDLLFEPGSKYGYSNDGYVLLASLIERVSGLSYEAFLRQHIFDPLGMESAYVEHVSEDTKSGWLQTIGADGIVVSAEDLFAFDRALQPGKLFTEKELEMAYTRPALTDGSEGEAGFGWRVAPGDERRVFHAGEGVPVKTGMQRYLDRETTIITIQTAHGPYFYKVFGAVSALWFGEPYELPQRRIVADVDPAIYEKYVGVYNTPLFGRIHITVEDGKLFLEPEGAGGNEELIPSSETTFYFGHPRFPSTVRG